MRFFIALEVPEENRQELKRVQTKIKELLPGARLTDNTKLHITIAFVGEEPLEYKTNLVNIINQAVIGIKPFEVTPAYLDGFPNIHHARTLWVGVKGDIDKLLILRERIKDGLASLRIPIDERRFTPHIAIAKVNNSPVDSNLENILENFMEQDAFAPITVTSIKLFESIPSEGFHSHNTLAEISLS